MKYKLEHIRYLNLPAIPQLLIDNFVARSRLFPDMTQPYYHAVEYDLLGEINQWGQEFICNSSYISANIIKGDLATHRDRISSHLSNRPLQPASKLCYMVSAGGSNVKTTFYEDDCSTVINEYIIQPNKWFLFDSYTNHAVHGIEPDNVRLVFISQMLHILV